MSKMFRGDLLSTFRCTGQDDREQQDAKGRYGRSSKRAMRYKHKSKGSFQEVELQKGNREPVYEGRFLVMEDNLKTNKSRVVTGTLQI